ncbi:MAG: LysM peptidoglycan-binding domain-containing protein, partial [Tannerellaceae bacterium]|nr:LysM peptidoglycan-binding domain-containing protein [Tannerellaceae bacterium]
RTYHDDDRRNECFRKYRKAEDSYEDHSLFLTGHSRYSGLFKLRITDYKGWARGLQKSGYATDKAYANKLIKLIEDYELYRFDSGKGIKKSNRKKQQQPTAPSVRRTVYKTHGLIYVVALSDDSFDRISRDLDFKPRNLIKYNEVPEDFPLQPGDIVYLQKKKKKADKPYYDHVVKIGESMHDIAQQYGIRIKNLYKMNKKDPEYIPTEGDVLKLR